MTIPPPLQPGDPDYDAFLDELQGYKGYNSWYDRDVNPITLRQWGILHNQEEYVRIAQDYLDDGHIWVSTVWLGLDHSWTGGPPLIFETMAFVRHTEEQLEERRRKWVERWPSERFPWEEAVLERYHTEDEAREGHRIVVDSLMIKIELLFEADS